MVFIEDLKKEIGEKRKLRESSIKVYVSNIKKLHSLMFDDEELKDLDFLKDKTKVMETIKDKKLSTRKTYLASIVVSLMALDKDKTLIKYYRDKMEELAKDFSKEMGEQKKSEVQDKNWVSLEALRKVMRKYRNELNDKGIFKKSMEELTNKEFELLQKWVVASLYILDENPPLRNNYIMEIISNKDYSNFSDEEKAADNYLVIKSRNSKEFSLGDYKTSAKYGTQTIPVGKKLNSVLNIWLNINKTGHLLLNTKKDPMTANGLTKFLQKTFEPTGKKNISSSMIRHIFISDKFPAVNDEKAAVAKQMLHSVDQQTDYAKKD
tara:strand:+ start:13116 stop:14081 length:966 start_codon:yes stop_codon:yes gene_type:complete